MGADAPAKLRCAVGPIPEATAVDPSNIETTPPPEVSPEVSETAASVASAIDDPELRALVARAARASLSRGASDRHF